MPRSFVGREDDLRRLAVAVDEAMAGHGSLVLVVGEPGIGKTRLAEEAASQASAAGTEVRWASCWESEGTPAYWPWAQLIRAHAEERDEATLAGELGTLGDLALALVPDVARRLSARATELRLAPGADSEPARLQLFEAVTALFRRAAASRPLLLVLDDVHWADTASLLLLHFAARELRRSRVLLLATYRDVEVHAGSERNRLLTQLGQEGRILILEGLDEEAVSQLLALTTGARPDSGLVADVHRRSAGNPLFVLELARLVSEQGRLGLAAGDLSIPGGVRVVLERRLGRLSPSCLEALSAAAVAGQEFQLDLLAPDHPSAAREAARPAHEARRAHLITSPEAPTGRWAFGHTLVREVLYERLPLARRAALHRATGEALLEARDPGRHLAELAHHFLSAGTPGDAYRAVVYGERAGQRALDLLAYEEGAASFERALEALDLCSEDGERRVELLLALGDARLRAGDLAAARDAFEEAARWARRRQRPDELARAALGFGAGLSGFEVRLFDTRQLDLLEEALLALGPEDSPLRAWTLARLSVALSFVASEERRRALAEEAVAMARRLEDRAALAYALGSHCDAIAGPSQAEERKAEATEIVRLAQETGDRGTELLGRRLRLVALLELGDMPAADAEVENFARTAEALRQPLYLWYVPLWRGMRALMEGRLADCERHQVEAEAVGSRAHSDNAAMGVQGQRLNLALERGRAEKAEAILRAMLDESLPLGYSPRAWLAAILARQGRTTEARALLDRLVAGDLAELPEEDAEWLPAVCQLAEACELLGAREAAERLYPRLLPHAGRFAVDGIGIAVLGSTARYLGLLAHLLGRADEATEHFEAALAAHRRAGSPLLVAAPSASTPRSSAPASSDETGSGPRPCWRRRPSPTGSSGSPPRPR